MNRERARRILQLAYLRLWTLGVRTGVFAPVTVERVGGNGAYFEDVVGASGGISIKTITGTPNRTVGLAGSGAYYTPDVYGNSFQTMTNQVFNDVNANGFGGTPAFVVVWLAGTFTVDATAAIKNPNTTLIGSGQRTTIFQPVAGLKGPIFVWNAMGTASMKNVNNLQMAEFSMDFTNAPSPVAVVLPAGVSTTLNGGINASQTNVTVTSGAGLTNGSYISMDSEIGLITAGGGTVNLTVTRGQLGTTGVTHANLAVVCLGQVYTHGTTGGTPATTECMVAVVPNGQTINAVTYAALGAGVQSTTNITGPGGPDVAASGGWVNSTAKLNQTPTNPWLWFMQLTDTSLLFYTSSGPPLMYYYPMGGIQVIRNVDNTAPIRYYDIEAINNAIGSTLANPAVATSVPWVGNVIAPVLTIGCQEAGYDNMNISIGGFLCTLNRGGSSRITNSTFAGWFHDGKSDSLKGCNIGNNGVINANYSGTFNTTFEEGCHHDGPVDTTNTTSVGTGIHGAPVYSFDHNKNAQCMYVLKAGDWNAAQTFQTDGVTAPTQAAFVFGDNASLLNFWFKGVRTTVGGASAATCPIWKNPATGVAFGWVKSADQTSAQFLKNNSLAVVGNDVWFNPGNTNAGWTRVRTGDFRPVTAISSGSPYTALKTDEVILVTTGAGGFTVTLPAANQLAGRTITIAKADSGAGAVTVSRAGADTIEGATSISLATQFKKCRLVSDGVSQWYDETINGV